MELKHLNAGQDYNDFQPADSIEKQIITVKLTSFQRMIFLASK